MQISIDLYEKLKLASIKGIIHLPEEEEPIQAHDKIKIQGRSLSEIIIEEWQGKW